MVYHLNGNGDGLRQCKEKVNGLNIVVADLMNERQHAEGRLSTCTWDLEIDRTKHSTYDLQVSGLNLEIEKLVKEKAAVASQLSELRKEQQEGCLIAQASQLSELVKKAKQEVEADLATQASQLSELKKEKHEAARKLASQTLQLSELNHEKQEAERKLATQASQLFELKNEKLEAEVNLVTQASRLSELKKAKQEVEADLATQASHFSELKKEKQEVERKLATQASQFFELQNEKQEAEANLVTQVSRLSELKKEKQEVEANLATQVSQVSELKLEAERNRLTHASQFSELNREKQEAEQKLASQASQLSELKNEKQEAEANLASQASRLSELKKEKQEVEADLATQVSQLSELKIEAERNRLTQASQLFELKNEKQEVEVNLAKCASQFSETLLHRKSFRCDPTSLTPYSFIATMNVSSSKLHLFIHTSGSHEANFDFFSQRNPGPIVGAVGQFNDGKTFLINGISCQVTRFAEGVDISTPGISVSRVVCEDGATFVLMDTAGLREAMKGDSGEGPVQDQLYTDLMLRMVDSYVLVVQEFTAPNQYFLDYVRKKLSPKVRVSVVHNFKHCTDQGQMESLANRTIRRVYPTVTKQQLFFLDPEGAPHYILGQNGSDSNITATNRQIFEHIRHNIKMIVPRPESIRERFQAAVSALLPPYLVQRDREASTTPISELLETSACEPLHWTETNKTLDELLGSPYKCSKVLQFSWPGAVLSLNKSSLQTGFLGVQKKDLRPRYVDYFTEERTKLAGLMMDLPGCDITLDRSGGVVCYRREGGATGALPSGWERLSADNVEQMRFMDQNEFILCNRHEYQSGILKLFYYRKREREEYLLCGDEASFHKPFIALMVVVSIVLMAYHRLYPAYRTQQMSRECKKELCDSFHRDKDLDNLKTIVEKYSKCTKELLEVAPFCHILDEVTRAKELPMRCPGCGVLPSSAKEKEEEEEKEKSEDMKHTHS